MQSIPQKAISALRTCMTRSMVLTFDKVNFTYTNLSAKRLRNWLLAELSYLVKTKKAWAYPTHLQVEPSSMCNLRCPVCHVVTDDAPPGLLTLEDFKRLIDEVGEYLLFLHFWGWGEPFLNDDIFPMIRYAHNKGIKIITSTNGHFFENAAHIDRLLDSGLDALIFALDGINAETYEKYRKQGDFAKACQGLRSLVQRKRERRLAYPIINLRMLVTRDNESQIPQMGQFAKELGVDLFTLKTLCAFDNEIQGKHLLPTHAEYRRFAYDTRGNPIRINNPCKKPWNHPTVYRDGTVVPCDYYNFRELDLGNAFRENGNGFGRIWFGKGFNRLRKRVSQGDTSDFRCGNCALNYADVDRCVSHAFRLQSSGSTASHDSSNGSP